MMVMRVAIARLFLGCCLLSEWCYVACLFGSYVDFTDHSDVPVEDSVGVGRTKDICKEEYVMRNSIDEVEYWGGRRFGEMRKMAECAFGACHLYDENRYCATEMTWKSVGILLLLFVCPTSQLHTSIALGGMMLLYRFFIVVVSLSDMSSDGMKYGKWMNDGGSVQMGNVERRTENMGLDEEKGSVERMVVEGWGVEERRNLR
ncbi:hypothetical protein Tco_0087843 [Tanacetum coccineum]